MPRGAAPPGPAQPSPAGPRGPAPPAGLTHYSGFMLDMSVGPRGLRRRSALGGGGRTPRRVLASDGAAAATARPPPPLTGGLRSRSSAQNGGQLPTRKRGRLSPRRLYMAGGRPRGALGKRVPGGPPSRGGGRRHGLAFPASPAPHRAHAPYRAFLSSPRLTLLGWPGRGLAMGEPAG